MIRIGIPTQGFRDWAGGVDFLFSVVDSLRAAPADVELHLLDVAPRAPRGWKRLRRAIVEALGGRTPERITPALDCTEIAARCDAEHRLTDDNGALVAAGRHLHLDAVLPSHGVLPDSLPCPWIGYLYDFQHRHLPHLFTDRERRKRDEAFARMVDSAPAVVVNSQDTASEARRLYPHAAARIHALPFNASPRPDWLSAPDGRPDSAPAGPYFLISNQFWVHKDHSTAFRAFARVANGRPDVRLVCTGQTSDFRRPDYFGTLVELLDTLGIRDRVTIAGLVPKAEQIALLRHAVAVIQPTLCEGGPGGGAVYDAVSLGMRAIVSDIPINRELADEPTLTFFRAGDPTSLAEAMHHALETQPASVSASVLRERGQARRAACGRSLLDIVAALRTGRGKA
jgi:glycosyltransferase involved in cell wall biosynthesis